MEHSRYSEMQTTRSPIPISSLEQELTTPHYSGQEDRYPLQELWTVVEPPSLWQQMEATSRQEQIVKIEESIPDEILEELL